MAQNRQTVKAKGPVPAFAGTRPPQPCVGYPREIDPALPSLAAALADQSRRGAKARATQLSSAVRTLARIAGTDPAAIPAHPAYLARLFQRLKPAALEQMGPGAWANLKSLIRSLVPKGPATGSRRTEFAPLVPEWAALRRTLGTGPTLWHLTRFLAFCSSRGILPNAVSDQAMGDFERSLAQGIANNPRARARAAIRAWNRCVEQVLGWPTTILTLPPALDRRHTLRLTDLPEELATDLTAWLDRLSRQRNLGEEGPKRPIVPVTRKHRHWQLLVAITAARDAGVQWDDLRSLCDLVQPETLTRLLQHRLDRQNGERSEALYLLGAHLLAVSTHHVRAPADQLTMIRRIVAQLEPDHNQLGERTRARLEALEDDRLKARLLHMPALLLEEAAQNSCAPRYRKKLAILAIAVEVALMTGLRRKNIAELRFGQDVKEIKTGKTTRLLIDIHPSQTKNRSRLIRELPGPSVHIIRRAQIYLPASDWLLPGRDPAKPINMNYLSNLAAGLLSTKLGTPINFHAIRAFGSGEHMAAGGSIEGARAFLGDRSDEVVRQSYTKQAEARLVAQAQTTLLKARQRLLPPVPKRRGEGATP